MNATFVALGRIKMVTPTIFLEFYSAYESFSKIEIYYLIVKIQNLFSGYSQDTVFCFYEYWSENIRLVAVVRRLTVFFFLFDKGVYAINQERLHAYTECAIIAFASVQEKNRI